MYICDITAFVLVIYRIAARPNSELRQKVLDLVSVLVSIKNASLGLGLGLDKKVLFTRLPYCHLSVDLSVCPSVCLAASLMLAKYLGN